MSYLKLRTKHKKWDDDLFFGTEEPNFYRQLNASSKIEGKYTFDGSVLVLNWGSSSISLRLNGARFMSQSMIIYAHDDLSKLVNTSKDVKKEESQPVNVQDLKKKFEPEPVKEPTKVPEPVKEPTKVSEPVKEPTKVPESVKEPTKVPEPVKEPTKVPEPVKEPTKVPEPVKEPTKVPEPEPEPVKEPTKVPEPVKEPTKVPEPEPVKQATKNSKKKKNEPLAAEPMSPYMNFSEL